VSMSLTTAERRQIENEMIFRRRNETITEGLEELKTMEEAGNDPGLVGDADLILFFRCECSDENCNQRIPVRLDEYQALHADRKMFIMKPGHEVDSLERVVQTHDEFIAVKKHRIVRNPGTTLHKTKIDNV
jgi:hypothetical protein